MSPQHALGSAASIQQLLSVSEHCVSSLPQMNQDLFVPISVVAQFKMVKQLCDDHETIVRVLKSSAVVQVRFRSHAMCSHAELLRFSASCGYCAVVVNGFL
jgi:hypothetical protein